MRITPSFLFLRKAIRLIDFFVLYVRIVCTKNGTKNRV